MKRSVIIALTNEKFRKAHMDISGFAQNLMGEWEVPYPSETPEFEGFGGGYGLLFWEEGNEDFLQELLEEDDAIVIRYTKKDGEDEEDVEAAGRALYENLYGLKIPYFSTERRAEEFPEAKERIEADGYEVLKLTGTIYL